MSEWMDGYQWGYLHGLEEGLRRGGDERDAEWEAKFGRAAQIVQAAARWPDRQTREQRMDRMREAERRMAERLDEIRKKQPGRNGWLDPPSSQAAVDETTTTQGGTE